MAGELERIDKVLQKVVGEEESETEEREQQEEEEEGGKIPCPNCGEDVVDLWLPVFMGVEVITHIDAMWRPDGRVQFHIYAEDTPDDVSDQLYVGCPHCGYSFYLPTNNPWNAD